MSTGKYLSLEEARNSGKIDRFANEHQTTGDEDMLDKLINAMAKTPESDGQTSVQKQTDED